MILRILDELQLMFQPPQRTTMLALNSAYAIWTKRYPEWEATFFDEHFLHTHVIPRFSAGQTPTATALAMAWVTQMGATPAQAAILMVELTPVAADFLYIVDSERHFFVEKANRNWCKARRLAAQLSGGSQVRRSKASHSF